MNTQTKETQAKDSATAEKLAQRFSDCCAEFRASIYEIANENQCDWQHVFRLWCKYSDEDCNDQSALLFEFKRNYRVELATGGRTIWNSDGLKPCLICAPSMEDVARMVGLPFDNTVEALEAENDDDTRTIGLPADESGGETDHLFDDQSPEEGQGEGDRESDAERNA